MNLTTPARLRERLLIATCIENGGMKWPDELKQAIDFAELFQDPACRTMAQALKAATLNGTIPPAPDIAAKLPKEKQDLLFAFHPDESLPLSCIEAEAEKFLATAKRQAVISTLADGYQDAHNHPEQAEAIAAKVREALDFALATPGRDSLTIRTPEEILAMTFDESDRILGDRLLAKGQSLVIAGQGGLGKSRLLLQFIAAQRAGLPFISFETRQPEMTWLVLQAENSNRRLRDDLSSLRDWIGEKHWPKVSAGIHIHTMEQDADNFLSLDNEQTQARIRELVRRLEPDGIVWDSLYNFGVGNLSSDEDMTGTLLAIARLSKAGNPERAIVVLHHALTGKAGASRATGFDRTSFGRNSKVLFQWTRGQINISPGSPDSNELLVVACGKCSNGQEFAPFAVRLDKSAMTYAVDESFDLSAWQSEVTGKKDNEPLMTPERVAELCQNGKTRAELAKAVMADCGCAREVSYRYVKRAEKKGVIKCNPKTDLFTSQCKL